ncbi:MAG TPA: DEAD/DEAH box helicase [Candidatus Gastranaerophilales bacterium]|nr:DEAD/DEAH box helicase [Candidatus Gastranaerophilales bacterium]
MNKLKFDQLSLSNEILQAVSDMGFEEASPIQSEAIPLLMSKNDIIGQAQTGTGKTAAFAIPLLENLDLDNKQIQALVLCPTRELVIQVTEEFRKLAKYKENVSVVAIYGGQQIERQFKALKKQPQIIVGTPGRTMDHMRRGSIKFNSVNTIVLDEADEMLDMGFREDIEIILKDIPENRQTVMFSATMPREIIDLTKKYQTNPKIINITQKKLDTPKIQQVYFDIQEKAKLEVLSRLIDLHNIKLGLVFCNTKKQVDELVESLKTRGYFAEGLHGDLNQNQRDKVMASFRNRTTEILVATDVAGRGIDVNDVEAVFNYDLPRDDEDYIHRIGRTGRAGKTGKAFTFVVGKQIYNLTRIQRANGMNILQQQVPSINDLESTKINTFISKVQTILEQGHLSNYINHAEFLMGQDYTALDVAAALIKMSVQEESKNFDQTIDFNEPAGVDKLKPKKRFNERGREFDRKKFFKKQSSEAPVKNYKSSNKKPKNANEQGFQKKTDKRVKNKRKFD